MLTAICGYLWPLKAPCLAGSWSGPSLRLLPSLRPLYRTVPRALLAVPATVEKSTDGAAKTVPGSALCRREPASGVVTPGTMSNFLDFYPPLRSIL